jgi:pimeloyl-ACP methyl ester carboxylesterase
MSAEISAPALIIAGYAVLRLMIVPEAGHALLMEQPDKVSTAIRDFIDQHD